MRSFLISAHCPLGHVPWPAPTSRRHWMFIRCNAIKQFIIHVKLLQVAWQFPCYLLTRRVTHSYWWAYDLVTCPRTALAHYRADSELAGQYVSLSLTLHESLDVSAACSYW